MPALVVGDRRPAPRGADAGEVARGSPCASRRRGGSPSRATGRSASGSQSQYGRPSCSPRTLGASGRWRASAAASPPEIMTGPMTQPVTATTDRQHRPTRPGLGRVTRRKPGQRAGHLEVGGCDAVELARRVRHARLRLRRGRHPRARPGVPRRLQRAHATTSRSSTRRRRRRSTRDLPAVRRGGPVGRRRLGRRAAHRRSRPAVEPERDLPARQQQDRGRAPAGDRGRGRPRRSATPSTRSPASTRLLDRPAATC